MAAIPTLFRPIIRLPEPLIRWRPFGPRIKNPWRFSFDRETGDMWIGDVGRTSGKKLTFNLPVKVETTTAGNAIEANHSLHWPDAMKSAYVFLLPNTGTVSVPVATVLPADTVTEVLIFLPCMAIICTPTLFQETGGGSGKVSAAANGNSIP